MIHNLKILKKTWINTIRTSMCQRDKNVIPTEAGVLEPRTRTPSTSTSSFVSVEYSFVQK